LRGKYRVTEASPDDAFSDSIATMISGFQCAGCGVWNETQIDSSAGTRQSYVEDCQVCCKPNVLHIAWDSTSSEYTVQAELES